ncbi:hypothetical protein [Legionella septentrionalis]|nr:hypothetical protein [Legionella septentrionalis]
MDKKKSYEQMPRRKEQEDVHESKGEEKPDKAVYPAYDSDLEKEFDAIR